ncbi:endonuclease/exonuclease/phosphatase family protein [Congregibacter sp.]|uniref:endonuclease/exonuclease/phosphatase family protein n=1 Tax=Congregibacter sp. TaxID=2744308 RepID=UPI003F6CC276
MSTKKHFILIVSAALLGSCATAQLGTLENANDIEEFQGLQLAPLKTALECRQTLGSDSAIQADEIDASHFSILNWNIKKGEETGWEADLERFVVGKQLVLLQEAALSMRLGSHLQETPFAAFSPGYVKDEDITGVVTFSDVKPISHCRLGAVEPWLGTPKSTTVTEYGLRESQQTLIVVNIHALNFSFGLLSYREQLNAIVDVLSDFEGPILLSGDLNTWRKGRQNALLEIAGKLGLRSVRFAQDYRQTAFGWPLDHVFVRGLQVSDAEVFPVSSSDHNPIAVTFSLETADSGHLEPDR